MATTVLFVPGCGNIPNLYERLEKAISMFPRRGGYICVSGGVVHLDSSRPEQESMWAEWESMAEYLVARDIPKGKIFTEKLSLDSVSNVTLALDIFGGLFSRTDTHIVIVSQRLHARRILRAFRARGKEEVEILPCPYGNWEQAFLGNCLYEPLAWLVYGRDPLGTGFLARMLRKILPRKTPPRIEKPVT